MKSRLVNFLWSHKAQPAQGFHARRDSKEGIFSAAAEVLAGGEHGGDHDGARMHRSAFERVVEVLTVRGGAIDERRVLRPESPFVADRGAGASRFDAFHYGAN